MELATIEISGGESGIDKEAASRHEPDLLPEYYHYKDEGCEFASSCLNCDFQQCLYDEPRGRQRWLKELRNREIDRLYGEGLSIKELAAMLGLSQRTIQRALKSTLKDSSAKKNGNRMKTKKLNEGELQIDE